MKSKSERVSRSISHGTNTACIEKVLVSDLTFDRRNPTRLSEKEVKRAKQFVSRYPDRLLPIMIDEANHVLVGGIYVEAARQLASTHLLVVRQVGLDEIDALLFTIGNTKLLQLGSWDPGSMDAALREFEKTVTDFSGALIGFTPGELDRIVGMSMANDEADKLPPRSDVPVSKLGSVWRAGNHRIMCGDATCVKTVSLLMDGTSADTAIVDYPFGNRINGFFAKDGLHREFVEGSGDKTPEQLLEFFQQLNCALSSGLRAGALVYQFIDWRGLGRLQHASEQTFGPMLQFCAWVKDRAGMGSFYRSQHELVLVFAKPGAPHRQNIELGKNGRDRSNVWSYPSAASSRKGRERDMLKAHPTPKSVDMIADAILDSTARTQIVLDTCLGSGTTLIAAERTNRVCHGMDLDPLYIDLAVRRWQEWTGRDAIDAETGLAFNTTAALRLEEVGDE